MVISIHALCEEGDAVSKRWIWNLLNFYPRPLRGGRPVSSRDSPRTSKISIHALCEEGDRKNRKLETNIGISIHALCEEGDVTTSK